MPRYTIEAPDGRQVTIEGDSEPTEQDLEEIFSSIPQNSSKPNDPTLPNSENVDQAISGREDMLGSALNGIVDQTVNVPNALSSGKNLLSLIGGVSQRAEASIANPLGEIQKGNINGQSLLNSFVDGMKGKVLGQYGDLIRRTGVGGVYNEALASTTGFLAALSAPELLTKGKVSSKIESSGKSAINSTDQALKDAVTNKTGFLEDVRSAFYDAKASAVDKYGAGLDDLVKNNPQQKVSLRPVIDQLNQQIALDPKLSNAINKVPLLRNFLDNPKLANSVELKEAQSLVNDLQSKISVRKLKGVGVRPDDIPLLDTVDDMKVQMVQAFPELADLRKSYGETINRFNLIRGKLSKNAFSGFVKNKFGNEEIASEAHKLLEESPEIISRLKNYHLIRKVGKTALLGAEAITGAAILKKVINA